ncbi:hypothetical protein GCM10027515_00110 [Schumannella luteola]|uniref:PBP domain-containing protein n=1 Tax=Schumannella luteola TaxID=472059 RepID=A0A852YM80_9MICO|nr:hypothetical protein [Schumannella luteola]NYG98849.1 hypothetical protein [Schumannella luteola]TPX02068.1 hypothetical protein FJ656_24320 [Schumannella luteola]
MSAPAPQPRRARQYGASLIAGLLSAGFAFGVGLVVTAPAPAAKADDSSAVTVSAKDQDADIATAPFPDLKLTVAQTEGLVSQAVVVSWSGGKPSTQPSQQNGGKDFLQFMQCWGDDSSVPAGQPAQPDRTTCQYGGFNTSGATRDKFHDANGAAPQDVAFSASEFSQNDYTSIPFQAVDGTLYTNVKDGQRMPGIDPNTNQFFTKYTTNEVPWAGSGADGTGSIKFEMQTKVQAPGLGCGDANRAADGTVTGRACWLVAVPRGAADTGSRQVDQSALFWDQWKHRIAVRLDFRPIGDVCAIGAAERQLQGSELMAGAVASWQPTLCTAKGGDAYTILSGTESDALAIANGANSGPMALSSRPLQGDIEDDLQYAPVALTGLAISFAIDRQPSLSGSTPDEYLERAKLPFTSMNLTPRLVAKLLTSSYRDALPYFSDRSHIAKNPRNIAFDPDFQAINDPEWKYQAIATPAIADALVPQGRSDSAWAIWAYVMSDQDARDFLSGKPDPWGMTVNKWASDSVDFAPRGEGDQTLAITYPNDTFPKADPVETAESATGGPINLVTWRPFVNDLDTSAYKTLRGDGQVLGGWNAQAAPPQYDKTGRDLPGAQAVIGVTDTSAASRYQTITASLRNAAGKFVAPSAESMLAAAAAMTATPTQRQVYSLDNTSAAAAAAPTAYPLTVPVYAAVSPKMSDATLRASFAAFIRYAVSDAAQTTGQGVGQLPEGYAPLPQGWRDQALAAAAKIQAGTTATQPTDASGDGSLASPGSDFGSADAGFGSAGDGFGSPDASGAAGTSDPAASGDLASSLSASRTPADPKTGGLDSVVPLSLLAGLLGALAVPGISLFRRRL